MLVLIFLYVYIFVNVYNRGGQSAARGPHAALQRFSAATVSNFGCTTQQFMTHLCMKIPEIYINLHLYVRKNKANFFLRPAIQYFNEIWPARKKVWQPLVYNESWVKLQVCFVNPSE